jgi:hypothetical protein
MSDGLDLGLLGPGGDASGGNTWDQWDWSWDGNQGTQGDNPWASGLPGWLGKVSDYLGGDKNFGILTGGLLGALGSQGGTMSTSKAPWSAAQPYLTGLLSDANTLRQQYTANPFTPQQAQAYQSAFNGINQAQGQMQGLLNFGQRAANGAYSFQLPSFQGLLGGAPPVGPQGMPSPSVGQPGPSMRMPTRPIWGTS